MISVFDIFLKMLKFVAPFNTKIVIMINVTRFVILGVIRKGSYSGSILQWDALFKFFNSSPVFDMQPETTC